LGSFFGFDAIAGVHDFLVLTTARESKKEDAGDSSNSGASIKKPLDVNVCLDLDSPYF
jgi:hypothetical protein